MKTNYKITLQPGDHCRRDMGEEKYRECVQRFFDDGMPGGGETVGSWEHEPFFGWSAPNKKAGLFHGIKTTGLAENRLSGRLLTHAEIMECEYEAEVGDVFEVTKGELAGVPGVPIADGENVTVREVSKNGFYIDGDWFFGKSQINNGLKYVGRADELQYDPGDVAFKSKPESVCHEKVIGWADGPIPPVGWHGECSWGTRVNWHECVILPNNKIARTIHAIKGSEWQTDKIGDDCHFRPLKSPRDRWVEEAMKQCRTLSKHDCQAIYDAGLVGGVE